MGVFFMIIKDVVLLFCNKIKEIRYASKVDNYAILLFLY